MCPNFGLGNFSYITAHFQETFLCSKLLASFFYHAFDGVSSKLSLKQMRRMLQETLRHGLIELVLRTVIHLMRYFQGVQCVDFQIIPLLIGDQCPRIAVERKEALIPTRNYVSGCGSPQLINVPIFFNLSLAGDHTVTCGLQCLAQTHQSVSIPFSTSQTRSALQGVQLCIRSIQRGRS